MSFTVRMLGLAVMFLMIGCAQSPGEALVVNNVQSLSGRRCMIGSPPSGYLLMNNDVEVKSGYVPSYCHGFLSFELPEENPIKVELVLHADEAYIVPDPALPPLDLTVERITFENMDEIESSRFSESGETAVLPLSSHEEVQGESIELRIDITDIINPSQNLQQFRLKISYGHLDNIPTDPLLHSQALKRNL